MPLNPDEIIRSNREACERLHKQWPVEIKSNLEPLRAAKLNETPFEITAALLWAYRRIEALQSTLAQAISRGCTCDHLYGASCNIHRLETEAGIEEAVAHLKALEEAAIFTKQFVQELEQDETDDPSALGRFGESLHAKLDVALTNVKEPDPKTCQCAFTDVWRCAVDQKLPHQIACHCECHIGRLSKAAERGAPNV